MANKSPVMEPPQSVKKHHHEEKQPEQESHQPAASSQGLAQEALAIPPALGKTPTQWSQLLPLNFGAKGSHFVGPLVSGGTPGQSVVQGSALLALILQVDYTMGSFTIPLQFPANSFLLWATSVTLSAWAGGTGVPDFQLGRTSGGAEILASTPVNALHAVAIAPVVGTTPLEGDAPAQTPYQAYLTVTANGATAGQGYIVITYVRAFNKWS